MSEQIEAIRARLRGRPFSQGGVSPWHFTDVDFLLSEVSRLKDEEKRAITLIDTLLIHNKRLEAVAEAAKVAQDNRDLLRHDDHTGTCAACWVEGSLDRALAALEDSPRG